MLLMQFGAPRLITKTSRSYMKIQELFALIGGLISGISISTQIMFFHYLRFKYLMHFYNNDESTSGFLNIILPNYKNNSFNNEILKIDCSKFSIEKNIKMNSTNLLPIIKLNDYNNNINSKSDIKLVKQVNDNEISKLNQTSQLGNLKKIIHFDNVNVSSNINIAKNNNFNDKSNNNGINQTDSNNITSINSDPSYFNYIISLLFCRKEYQKSFSYLIDKVEKALDIKTYFNLIKVYSKTQE